MGTLFRITLYADSRPKARTAAVAAFARVKQLDEILSDYKPDSELSKLTGHHTGEWIAVSAEMFYLLNSSMILARDTGGAFDVTAGPLIRLWREARKSHAVPTASAIEMARSQSGYQSLELDPRRRAVRMNVAGMKLDLGAIAKGYAAEEALRILRQNGLPRALVAASGDLAVGDPPPAARGWRIAIEPSIEGRKVLPLRNCGVSTSGDANQYVEIEGIRYSHIIDARSGQALKSSRGVTVVSKHAMDADALATAACILGRPVPHRRARYFK